MDGIVFIDKPKGWTSFDVVAKVRGTLRAEARKSLENRDQRLEKTPQNSNLKPQASKVKVGHTGTLDPLATGLLIIVTGSYCKRAQEFSKLDKVYEAEVTLGQTSTTDDDEGVKTAYSDFVPDEKAVLTVLRALRGEILQTPPPYSAIKVDGQRAYKAARKGKEVVIEPRKVTIYDISEVNYEYPKLTFIVKVSSGTYIRSLARDIGAKLGTGAYLSGLRRIQVGNFDIKDALSVEDFAGTTSISNVV